MTTADTTFLRDIQIPSGRPTIMQKTTDRMVTISVSMLSSQYPNTPKSTNERVTRIVDRRPANT